MRGGVTDAGQPNERTNIQDSFAKSFQPVYPAPSSFTWGNTWRNPQEYISGNIFQVQIQPLNF